ncbi:glycosyltransferase family 2 protein [Polynucleobacter sp. UB-Raua-W9]|uniref:glycosyltransferase family 2 protein n=1 Tax=Polynucleobacter sp. UB-Raua-W9 TaxID=1819736 RepID=UPI001BFE5311|nr:glycosyltransferase family 2 protein [Polynucleobacter sp. UB-Raua-W9]QWD72737.1 glycosyltransferase family 2 protein [Polynucleobacter sp. UB-Raua-W9]
MKNLDSVSSSIAVVIPCYRVTQHILELIALIGPEVSKIYVVDDSCPDKSGELVRTNCVDKRVSVIFHKQNMGVGGAVMTGYRAALDDEMDVIVKIDGDGQMDPALIPDFIGPILDGHADYTKGNRFFNLEEIQAMPKIRLFGNAILSFMTKFSSGYWDLFDPTNGYTAIHSSVAKLLPLKKISNRYFFETDMLFRLNTLRAVVVDVPMDAKYSEEISNLKISKILGEFLVKHMRNFFKRIFYNYYLRDMSVASLELPLGIILFSFGVIFGCWNWVLSVHFGVSAPVGTIMLSALPTLMGLQLLLAFLAYDISTVPKFSIYKKDR